MYFAWVVHDAGAPRPAGPCQFSPRPAAQFGVRGQLQVKADREGAPPPPPLPLRGNPLTDSPGRAHQASWPAGSAQPLSRGNESPKISRTDREGKGDVPGSGEMCIFLAMSREWARASGFIGIYLLALGFLNRAQLSSARLFVSTGQLVLMSWRQSCQSSWAMSWHVRPSWYTTLFCSAYRLGTLAGAIGKHAGLEFKKVLEAGPVSPFFFFFFFLEAFPGHR